MPIRKMGMPACLESSLSRFSSLSDSSLVLRLPAKSFSPSVTTTMARVLSLSGRLSSMSMALLRPTTISVHAPERVIWVSAKDSRFFRVVLFRGAMSKVAMTRSEKVTTPTWLLSSLGSSAPKTLTASFAALVGSFQDMEPVSSSTRTSSPLLVVVSPLAASAPEGMQSSPRTSTRSRAILRVKFFMFLRLQFPMFVLLIYDTVQKTDQRLNVMTIRKNKKAVRTRIGKRGRLTHPRFLGGFWG